jgi:RNA polymerase sigma-70 factor (ECF subfamily)
VELVGKLVRGREGALRSGLDPAMLVRSATGGDRDAFEALISRYQDRVYRFAYHYVHDAAEAHDLAQEIFLRLYRNLSRFDTDRAFEPWFWRLAANVALNYRQRRIPLPVDTAGVEKRTDDEGGDAVLGEALARLESGQRLPLLLHYYLGLPVQEVAVVLGLSVAATKARMHRARHTLRRLLAEDGGWA